MAYKHRTATSVTIFLTIAMTLTQSLGFVVEDVLPPDADSYSGYSYNLDDIYAPGDEHAFAGPIASIMKLNEHLVQNRDTTLRDLVPDDFADLFRLLMSGELLANEDFLVQLGDKLAVELEGRLGHDLLIDAEGRIYEINPEEQDDVIQQTTDEPPAGESGVSADCRRDFARLLEPITNKIAYQGYRLMCALGYDPKVPGLPPLCTGLGMGGVVRRRFPVVDLTDWGLKMLDFFGKPGPGITGLNIHWVGEYDACNNLKGSYSTNDNTTYPVNGKYCRIAFNRIGLNLPFGLNFNLGLCLPNTCNAEEVSEYIETGDFVTSLIFSQLKLEVRKSFCGHDLDLGADSTAVLTVSVIMIIICIVVAATVYDTWIRPYVYTKKMPHAMKINGSHQPEKNSTNNADLEITVNQPGTDRQISTISGSSDRPLFKGFQTQISVSSNNTYLSEDIHNHDAQEPITCLQRLEVMFVSFSMYANIRFMFRGKRPVGWMHSIDGFRVLTACWVVFGYSFLLGTLETEAITTKNVMPKVLEWIQSIWFQLVINMHHAADTFLVINGCLVTYWWLKAVKKNDGKISVLMLVRFYVHRYWRLIPTLLLVLMVYTCMYQYLTAGPLNPSRIQDAETCKDKWWMGIFMIQNVVDTKEQCLSWSWIIAVSYQLHVITPLVLVPLVIKPVAGFVMWGVLWVVFFVASAIVIPDSMPNGIAGLHISAYYTDILQAPWCQAAGYLIGMAVGYVLYKCKCKMHINRLLTVLLWCVAGAILLVSVFITRDSFQNGLWGVEDTTTYLILSKVGFSLGIGWMIFACETGNGGGIGRFLAWGAWRGLSFVTFIMMLITPLLIYSNVYSKRQTMYMEVTQVVYHWTGNLFTIFSVSLIFCVGVEQPLRNISRGFFYVTKDQAIMAGNHRKVKKTE